MSIIAHRSFAFRSSGPVSYTTDWTRAQTVSSQDRSGGVAWTNVANIADADEATEAVVYTYNSPYTSDWARCTNFDFSAIPSGATIRGIEMRQRVRYDGTYGSGVNRSLEIFTRKTSGQAGSNIVSNPQIFGTVLAWESWGGAANLWGATWSRADIVSADFGFDVCHEGNSVGGISYIAQVQARITYEV